MSFKKNRSLQNEAEDMSDLELLQCMICFETFKEPKMLNCAHTFCAECLEGYHATYTNQKRAVSGQIPCPNCRELTPWPSNGAAGLRTDFKVHQIEDLLKTMSTQVQNVSSLNICGSCNAQGKKIQAKSYCFNCEKSYCSDCTAKHSKNTLFTNHKVVTVSSSSNQGNKEINCLNHSEEICKYLCRTCDTLVCTLCLINEHNKHEAVEIKVVIKEQVKNIDALMTSVNEKRDNFISSLNEFGPLVTQCLNSCSDAEKSISTRSEKLIADIKRKEVELLSHVRATRDKKLLILEKEVNRMKMTLSQIKGIENLMNNSTLTPSKCFKTYELLMQRMKTIVEVDSHHDVRNLMANAVLVHFNPSQDEVDSLGQISEARVKFSSHNNASSSGALTNNSKFYVKHASRPLQKNGAQVLAGISPVRLGSPMVRDSIAPRLLLEINKQGSQPGELDEPLWVASLIDCKFVVSERRNKRLQIFERNGRSTEIIASNSMQPWGVSVTFKNNIIVADANQKRIQVFSPDGKTLSKWGDGKFFSPCGAAVCPNGNIVISDVGDNTVSVFRSESNCSFRLGVSAQPDQQFNEPFYVATGPHNEVIVSDSKNNCLKIFDSKGKFITKIGSKGSKDGEFNYPCGVCTTIDGNLLIADLGNDRISMVTRNGMFLGHVLTAEHGIRSPRAICFTPKNKLIVTESSASRSVIKVFEMSM